MILGERDAACQVHLTPSELLAGYQQCAMFLSQTGADSSLSHCYISITHRNLPAVLCLSAWCHEKVHVGRRILMT